MSYHDERHTAHDCLGGTGWVGDTTSGGMPWDPCPDHWPTHPVAAGRFDGPRREFVRMHPDEVEAMFPVTQFIRHGSHPEFTPEVPEPLRVVQGGKS